MSRIFITGSADGLGLLAAKLLIQQGHSVVLHARNADRAKAASNGAPGAETVVIGDLSDRKETAGVAEQVNRLGVFDAVIHNAAMGYRESRRNATADGLAEIFAVNSLAPYILTCLIQQPNHLIYMSSALHQSGDISLKDLAWGNRPWNGFQAYSDSKLHNAILAFAVARKWPDVCSNAVEPGWVPTKMGGSGAPDNLEEGAKTQAWLAASNDPAAQVSGRYFIIKNYGRLILPQMIRTFRKNLWRSARIYPAFLFLKNNILQSNFKN